MTSRPILSLLLRQQDIQTLSARAGGVVCSPRPRGVFALQAVAAIPPNALLDGQGNPILDASGNFIIVNSPA